MSFDFIPARWRQKPLSQAGKWLSGGTPSRANKSYWGGSFPWLGTKDLVSFRLEDAQEHLTTLGAANATRVLEKGAIVFAVRGMSLAKEFRVGVTQRQMAFNQDIKAIVPSAEFHPTYLGHYLRYAGPRILQRVETASHGTKRLPLDRLENVPVPLPSLDEQRRIADILDKADAIRRKRKEAIALTEELLRSAFLDMFGDPVTNPKGWPVKSLGELGTLDRGKSRHRPRNDPRLLGGAHPLIQTGEVANSGGIISEHTQTYSDFGLAQSRIWPPGTLCITIAASIARTGILTFDACFPDSVVGFTPGADVSSEFIQGWMSFLQPMLEARADQVAQKNINLRVLRELLVPVPNLEVIRTPRCLPRYWLHTPSESPRTLGRLSSRCAEAPRVLEE